MLIFIIYTEHIVLHERSLKESLQPAGTAAAAPPETSEPAVASSSTQEQPSKAEETQKPAEAGEQSKAKEETESQPEAKKEETAAALYSEATKPLAEMPSTAAAAPVPEAVKKEEEEGTTERCRMILLAFTPLAVACLENKQASHLTDVQQIIMREP